MGAVFIQEGVALGLAWGKVLGLWTLGLKIPFLVLFFLMRGWS
jgi:hypothetical protein